MDGGWDQPLGKGPNTVLVRREPCSSTWIMHSVPGWKQISWCALWLWYAGPWALPWDLAVVPDISRGNSETCWVLSIKSIQALL